MQILEKIQSQDEVLNRVQDRVAAVLNPLAKSRLLDGRLIEGVVLGAVEMAVSHGLDRSGVRFIVVNPNADARVWSSSPTTDRLLFLTASGAVTVDLWVF